MTAPYDSTLERIRIALTSSTTAAQLEAAAEAARAAVQAIAEATSAASRRRTEILAQMHRPIVETKHALAALDADNQSRLLDREIAAALAAALDVKAKDAAKSEAVRDKARQPFAEQARRAQAAAAEFSRYPALAKRLLQLLRTDVVAHQMARIAYSHVHEARGANLGMNRRASEPPRVLALPFILENLRLPLIRNGTDEGNVFPFLHGDLRPLEAPGSAIDADDDILSALATLIGAARNGSPPSEDDVDRAVSDADQALHDAFDETCSAIEELVRLDALISNEDLEMRYPDGARIFDPSMFANWMLRRTAWRIVLPDLDSGRRAA